MPKLYELLDQLTANSLAGTKLRRKFHDDPDGVTTGLDVEGKKALFKMKRGLITARVNAEYAAELPPNDVDDPYDAWFTWFMKWPFPPKEFPKSELPPACANETSTEYPDPTPEVFSINPASAPASSPGPVHVGIVGQGFVNNGKTSFVLEGAGGATLPVANIAFTGTFRCAHLSGDVTMPASAGKYAVRVFVTLDAATTIEVPSNLVFDVT